MTNIADNPRSIELSEFVLHLDARISDVESGETILIVRGGRPVATLAPIRAQEDAARETRAPYATRSAAPLQQPPTALLRVIGTPAARSVLGVFVVDPARAIHQREIARRAGVGLRSAQLALERLEALGLLQSERDGNRRYYRANRTSRFEDLRALLSREFGIAEAISAALAPFAPRISRAFIFGSVASGEDKIGSDIDLLVVGEVTGDDLVERIADVQRGLGREIDLLAYSQEEFEARLSGGNHFLVATMAGPRIDLIGDSG
jgi:predicted nucleotidyltransferase/antitoxin (DNA-binding transcriptional repressor) of toxin-antitoxin stability system